MPGAETLISGYWGVHPSPVVETLATAWTILSGPSSGAAAGTAPQALTIRRDQAVSPGPDGRPTTGYPLPDGVDPVWVVTNLAGGGLLSVGADFSVEDGYAWFVRDPLLDNELGYLLWAGSGFVTAADIWLGTRPAAASPPETLPGTSYAIARALADTCDAPITGKAPETLEDAWQAEDDSWTIVTDLNAYRLPPNDHQSVAIGDVMPPGSSVGVSWAIDKLDHTTHNSAAVVTPKEFHQGVTVGNISWHIAMTPLIIDTSGGRTRVRFALGGTLSDVDAVWTASMTNGIANGRTLAQALDTRANPVGDPGPESLPTVISPMKFFCTQLSGGCIYRVILKPDRFGANAGTIEDIKAAVRVAAGSFATVFIWEDQEPVVDQIDPS